MKNVKFKSKNQKFPYFFIMKVDEKSLKHIGIRVLGKCWPLKLLFPKF